MAISFDKTFGIHDTALQLRDKRTEVLAANLANADTPGYKARDINFDSVLAGTKSTMVRVVSTHSKHITTTNKDFGGELLYRIPNQPSIDGNTVESQVEQAKFSENALRYQASLNFINGRIAGIKSALRGD